MHFLRREETGNGFVLRGSVREYYEGRMYQIEEAAKENPVLKDWNKIGYVSELSDFLQNILEDEAKDYGHLKIPSVH